MTTLPTLCIMGKLVWLKPSAEINPEMQEPAGYREKSHVHDRVFLQNVVDEFIEFDEKKSQSIEEYL